MKKLFYIGIAALILFEFANVYFVMLLPGSQEIRSLDVPYFLHNWRWVFRLFFGAMVAAGLFAALKNNSKKSKVISLIAVVILLAFVYVTNFVLNPDAKFLQTQNLQMKNAVENKVDSGRIIIGINYNGIAKAYPIQYLGYHHLVFDTIAGKPIMVTYCILCRTGRVYEPIVNDKPEKFKLVGIDQYNAVLQDITTESWWQQATGQAIKGSLKGSTLPELGSYQMQLKKWLQLYPGSLIMQPDKKFLAEYKSLSNYETGNEKTTAFDTIAWLDKSWVAGITIGNDSKAYDWKKLEKQKVINDVVNNQPIAIVLSEDNKSFTAVLRNSGSQQLKLFHDTLQDGQNSYSLTGKSYNAAVPNLETINAYQQNWYSWRTFHPGTKKYE